MRRKHNERDFYVNIEKQRINHVWSVVTSSREVSRGEVNWHWNWCSYGAEGQVLINPLFTLNMVLFISFT